MVQAEPVVQLEEDTGSRQASELNNINEIIANILSSQDDDSFYQELGRAVSGSKYLSPEELVNEISKQAVTIEDEQAKKKIQDILEVSNKILLQVEPLHSSIRKITKLDFWISDDHADKPHVRAFLEGQKIELKRSNQNKKQLLGDIFKDLSRIQDAGEKIKYLNEKLNDPAHRHLRSTISTIIENLENEIDLEPSNISAEWIDAELANTGDLDASLDWLSIRKCLLSFQDYSDHLDLKTAEIEEKLEEDTFTESVKTNLEKKEGEGKKPVVYKNIISLTRVALEMESPGKRQKLIKEQEVLAPHNDGGNNLYKKQRKLLFYLMSTPSDKGNKRLKALADRVSMPFKEKQEYLKILKLSKYKDKEGNPVTWKGELGITDEDIAYYAGYILGLNKPFEERIAYLEKVRDENVNETYTKYKENYGITPNIFNKIISDLKNKSSANRDSAAEGSSGTEKEPSHEKNTETHAKRRAELSNIASQIDELFNPAGDSSSHSISPVEVLKKIQRKQDYYDELHSRIKERGKKGSEDIAASGDLAENVESISEEHKSDPEDRKAGNVLNKLLARLASCEAYAVGDIIEEIILPSLSKTGDNETGAMLKNLNKSVFIPALKGENVDTAQIKEFFNLKDNNLEKIETILQNIKKVWHEEIKNEITNEEKKIDYVEQADATNSITSVLNCLLEADPARAVTVLQNDFIEKVDPTLVSLIKKLKSLNAILTGKTSLKIVDDYFGNDADLVKKLAGRLKEHKKVEKSAGIPGAAGVKTDETAGPPAANIAHETQEEITEVKTGIPDEITKALTGTSNFIKPHSAIVKAAKDEAYSGRHNRDKRQSIISQLYNGGKIFTYDGGSTYIGWGKIAEFVGSQAYKEKSTREKRMFAERLNRYLKRFKIKEDKYVFLGIQTDNKIKMENNFKLLLKRIGSHDTKKPSAVSGTGKKQKKPAPVKTRKRTGQASNKPKKTAPRKKDKQKKERKPKIRETPSPKTAKQKDSSVKKPVRKETKRKAAEPEDPTAVVLEALDKNMKAILLTANGRLTKKLAQILGNTNNSSELSKLYDLYLKPGNQESLLKLLEVFILVNESLFSAIKESRLLTKGLGFNRKKIMKFYEKKKKNFAKTKSKSDAA